MNAGILEILERMKKACGPRTATQMKETWTGDRTIIGTIRREGDELVVTPNNNFPCLFEAHGDTKEAMGLACPCPKCTPTC